MTAAKTKAPNAKAANTKAPETEAASALAGVSRPDSKNLDYSLYQATPLGVTLDPTTGDMTFSLLGGSTTDGGEDDKQLRVTTMSNIDPRHKEGYDRLAEFFCNSTKLSLVGEPGLMTTLFRDGQSWVTAPPEFRP